MTQEQLELELTQLIVRTEVELDVLKQTRRTVTGKERAGRKYSNGNNTDTE